MSPLFDDAIVGAGCSGLTLASHLADKAPFVTLAVLGSMGWNGYRFMVRKKLVDLSRALEPGVILVVFYMLPALLAFTIYFTFLHSIRHLLYVAGSSPATTPIRALGKTYVRSMPVIIEKVLPLPGEHGTSI